MGMKAAVCLISATVGRIKYIMEYQSSSNLVSASALISANIYNLLSAAL